MRNPAALRCSILLAILACTLVHASVWPRPKSQVDGRRQLFLRVKRLKIRITGADSDLLRSGLDRFWGLLDAEVGSQEELAADGSGKLPGCEAECADWLDPPEESGLAHKRRRHSRHRVRKLRIHIDRPDQSLGLSTDESYSLCVRAPKIRLKAKAVFGALHGLETLAQLVRRGTCVVSEPVPGDDPLERRRKRKKRHHHVLMLQETDIHDKPRFPHRGLLIDSARHFLSLDTIKAHLDAMAASKLNVLHWHLTDDQSFPFGSEVAPELPAAGAFSANQVYSLGDMAEVVAYARKRGIRVIPELDTPGHTLSWGRGRPDLLTPCFDPKTKRRLPGVYGPIDATKPAAYGLIWELLREVSRVFPDGSMHLGGDEVDSACWENNPDIRQWMREHGKAHTAAALQQRWELRVQGLVLALGRTPTLWEEAFSNGEGAGLDDRAVVHVWKWWRRDTTEVEGSQEDKHSASTLWARNDSSEYDVLDVGPEDPAVWRDTLNRVTAAGHPALLSAPWYLNLGTYAGQDWRHYYEADPRSFKPSRTKKQFDLVLGGEACLWGEFVDDTNALQRAWPAAAAVAERLWSPENFTKSVVEAEPRLAEHRCRLVARGIPASPIGPGTCAREGAYLSSV